MSLEVLIFIELSIFVYCLIIYWFVKKMVGIDIDWNHNRSIKYLAVFLIGLPPIFCFLYTILVYVSDCLWNNFGSDFLSGYVSLAAAFWYFLVIPIISFLAILQISISLFRFKSLDRFDKGIFWILIFIGIPITYFVTLYIFLAIFRVV